MYEKYSFPMFVVADELVGKKQPNLTVDTDKAFGHPIE